MIEFKPDTEYVQDLIDPILRILNNQRISIQSQMTPAKMNNFLTLILKRSNFQLPYKVKTLPDADMKKLKEICNTLAELTALFTSVSAINVAYRDKENYVIKRVYELI